MSVYYVLRSPVKIVEVEYEYTGGDERYEYDLKESTYNFIVEDLRSALRAENENLAEYLDEDFALKGVIKSIVVDVDRKGACTRVEATRELTEEEKKHLLDYVEGQYSDGWGEGFEQNYFTTFNGEVEYYDDEEDQYVVEESTWYVHAKFWDMDDFEITIEEA